jgi:UDP-N-acetylmuramoyl-tripeptide--D-alanyl-D-alanine ligase
VSDYLTAGAVAALTGGTVTGNEAALIKGAVIDSRAAGAGLLFVALKGQNADGHDFVSQALSQGAAAALVTQDFARSVGREPQGTLIAVTDTLQALQDLAQARCKQLSAHVIAITGSSGKTTTKDLTAAVLGSRYRTHKTSGNYNNEIGLPLTVLNAPPETEMLVLEMGMRGTGQVAALCTLCSPETAVLTNIGDAHIEFLGSREKIAAAKWELVESLPSSGRAVLNAEDSMCAARAATWPGNEVFYGIDELYHTATLKAEDLRVGTGLHTLFRVRAGVESAEVALPLAGRHHILDALAALAVGRCYGISLAEGATALATVQLSGRRLTLLPGQGCTILDDTYNANPDSVRASLLVLRERGGSQSIAVLGDMLELGDLTESRHRQIGAAVAELGISRLVTVGELSSATAAGALAAGYVREHIHHCPDWEAALPVVRELIDSSASAPWVLVKGSRAMRLEELSRALSLPSAILDAPPADLSLPPATLAVPPTRNVSPVGNSPAWHGNMDTVLIGEVLKPQGLGGELKIFPVTDDPTRFLRLAQIILQKGERRETKAILRARLDHKNLVYLQLEGITDAAAAEPYRRFEVRVDKSEVPPLPAGRWYYYELEGMSVYNDGELLGTLERVLATGANDVYIVRGGGKEICVPALKTVVLRVDVPGRRMDVHWSLLAD